MVCVIIVSVLLELSVLEWAAVAFAVGLIFI